MRTSAQGLLHSGLNRRRQPEPPGARIVARGDQVLPHCSLEVRQDLIPTRDDARAWGFRLAPAIEAAVTKALG